MEKENFEKDYIIAFLEHMSGNISRASELAGKYRPDFYNLLKKHRLNPKDFK